MSGKRINGGIRQHALDRLFGQYNFKGSEKDARRLFRACKNGEKSGIVLISSKDLSGKGITKEKLERWGIPDGMVFLEIIGGVVDNIKDVAEYSRKRIMHG